MSQKTNKIILLIGLVLVLGILSFAIFKYLHSDKRLVSLCEKQLQQRDETGKFPVQNICVLKGNKYYITEYTNKGFLYPEQKVIVSIEFPKIFNSNQLTDRKTGKTISFDPSQKHVFCFVVFPTLVDHDMPNYDQNIIDNYVKDFKWTMWPPSVLDSKTHSEEVANLICTKPISGKEMPIMSLQVEIPKEDYLKLGNVYSRFVGLKTLIAPDEIQNEMTPENIKKYYDDFSFVYFFMRPIVVSHSIIPNF